MQRSRRRWSVVAAALAFAVFAATALSDDAPPRAADPAAPAPPAGEPAPPEDGVEVQTRGPVHEAFAQPSTAEPEPGPVVPKDPPKPVPETPPDQKPEGRNVEWIPGYWAWDADRNDYVWVSGCWRAMPPGRRWVPGHWAKVEGGWQWVAGFWGPDRQDELQYLPAPPRSLDLGPSAPAPDENALYVPGNWVFREDDYWWRPGYWAQANPDWLWTPSCYYWTPAGYCYCPGYWDYPLGYRGLCFAPVFFSRPLWQTAGWSYRPWYCVNPGSLLSCLFVGPYNRGYYFGNYFGAPFARAGFRPWYGYGSPWHNTLYSYNRWTNRANPNWTADLRAGFAARANGTAPLPAATLAAQNAVRAGNPNVLRTVTSLNQLSNNAPRLSRVQPSELRSITTSAQRLQAFGGERSRLEQRGPAAGSALRTNPGVTAAPSGTSRSLSVVPSSAANINPGPSAGVRLAPQGGAQALPRITNGGAAQAVPRIYNGNTPWNGQPRIEALPAQRPWGMQSPSVRSLPSTSVPFRVPTTQGAPSFVNPGHSYSPPVRSYSPAPHYSAPRMSAPSHSAPRSSAAPHTSSGGRAGAAHGGGRGRR